MTTDNPKFSRYMWMIPLIMLALAILACDEVYVPPPMVDRVEADDNVQGKVYITVVNVGLTYYDNNNLAKGKTVAYESSDYGMNWQHTEHVFAKTPANSYAMMMYGETLDYNGYHVWTFPRSMFRTVFYDDSGLPTTARFQLPDGFVANAAQDNQMYIAMGTQGVLIAKLEGTGFAPDWHVSATGIDTLTPLPMTITQPTNILGIILLILCVPPFALVHAFLLQRVWAYVLPPKAARRLALMVTAGLVVLAIIGIIVWLTSDRIDLYEVIVILTAITVLVGVTVTLWLTRKAGVTRNTQIRLAVAAILVSLIVPGGVAAIFAMWWLVFGVVFCYWAYQRAYWRYIAYDGVTAEGRIQRWRVDRLALEMVLIIVVGIVAIIIQQWVVETLLFNRVMGYTGFIELFGIAIVIAILYFVIRHYSRQRAKSILQLSPDVPGMRESRLMTRDLWLHTIYWIFLAVVLTGATFFGQMMAYGWFTSLTRIKPNL